MSPLVGKLGPKNHRCAAISSVPSSDILPSSPAELLLVRSESTERYPDTVRTRVSGCHIILASQYILTLGQLDQHSKFAGRWCLRMQLESYAYVVKKESPAALVAIAALYAVPRRESSEGGHHLSRREAGNSLTYIGQREACCAAVDRK